MSQKLAFDTLITVLSCLLPTPDFNEPVDLSRHPAFMLENPDAFCKAKSVLEEKVLQFEKHKEQNEEQLLRLSYELLELKSSLEPNLTQQNYPKDCRNRSYGVHKLRISRSFSISYTVCDEDDWMLILQHKRHSKNEYRAWSEIVHGYGLVYEDYFIGLEKIYTLSRHRKQEALIVFRDRNYETYFARYQDFSIKPASQYYALEPLGTCRGSACDEQNRKFGGKQIFDLACAKKLRKEWWDFGCFKNAQIKIFLRPQRKQNENFSDIDYD